MRKLSVREELKMYIVAQNTQCVSVAFAVCPLISPALYHQSLYYSPALLSPLIIAVWCNLVVLSEKVLLLKVNSINETLSPFQ